jgi:hypothetical protein
MRKRLYLKMMVALPLLASLAWIISTSKPDLITSAQSDENAFYRAGPAPWDGWVPTLTLSYDRFNISTFLREDEENKFSEGQTYTFKDFGLWNACKDGANPPCGFLAEGTIKLMSYTPRHHIAGVARIESIGNQLKGLDDATTTPSEFNGPIEFNFFANYKEASGCADCGPEQ